MSTYIVSYVEQGKPPFDRVLHTEVDARNPDHAAELAMEIVVSRQPARLIQVSTVDEFKGYLDTFEKLTIGPVASKSQARRIALTAREADALNADVVVDEIPDGYRWATSYETENWTEFQHDMVQVRRGGPDEDPHTDLAIRKDAGACLRGAIARACDAQIDFMIQRAEMEGGGLYE